MDTSGSGLRGALFFMVTSAAVAACGNNVHDAMRPAQPLGADATGSTHIQAVDGPSSPLVVDWKAEQRADLEEAIHDGIAIVAWDDQGLRLLKRCTLAGSYGYLPVQVKKDVVRLESADDVKANLPTAGLGIIGKIGGGFSQGTTLDIALAMVGKRRTTWNQVTRDDLTGDCDGATHYVRAILVGAFAMKTGSRANAAAAAEIFGAGASGASSSSKDVSSTDGRLDACDQASGEESKPPSQCAAILRLELEPISKAHPPASPAATGASSPTQRPPPDVKAEVAEGCPPGMVFSQNACRAAAPDRPHACRPDDAADCDAQCKKGDGASCDRLGSLVARGKAGPPDPARALASFQSACDLGYANGCANLGIRLAFGPAQDATKGVAALDRGCSLGSARACEISGEAALQSDAPKALKMFSKGCDGGDFMACTNAGFILAGGGGSAVQRDDAKALEFARRACFGGEAVACGNAGYKIELGESVQADPKAALVLYDRACRLEAAQCFRDGMLLSIGGTGVPKDDTAAKQQLDKSCGAGQGIAGLACVVAGGLYGSPGKAAPGGLDHVISVMKPQCDQKEGRACTFLGIAEIGRGKKQDAAGHLKAGCDFKDPLGCELAKKLK
jgi:TPR repeat protein